MELELEDLVREYIAALDAEHAANAETNRRLRAGEMVTINLGPPVKSTEILGRIRAVVGKGG
jgi:hypothetical protein